MICALVGDSVGFNEDATLRIIEDAAVGSVVGATVGGAVGADERKEGSK